MKNNDELRDDVPTAEVQTRRRLRFRALPPFEINDLEDPRAHADLMQRMFTELPPAHVVAEGDLITLGRLRWASDRLHNINECELNRRVRVPLLGDDSDSRLRLAAAYQLSVGEKWFQVMHKQRMDFVKTMNTMPARVEKWAQTKPGRSPRTKEL